MAIDYNKIFAKRRNAKASKQVIVHELVAEVAKGIAAEFYEIAAQDNNFYKLWPSQEEWVAAAAPRSVAKAREVLGAMLANSMTPDWQKEQIYEALCLDGGLPRHDGLH